MKQLIKTGIPVILTSVFLVMPLMAAEIDFSCMSYKVWGKGHVSDQFKEYDVVLQNRCPGSVFWAMCIERLDPVTHDVVETHNPTGYVEVDKKARVNLQLKKGQGKSPFRNRFQEFYVNIGYAIEMPVSSDCFAKQCETKKRGLRTQIRTNEAAWERAEKALAARLRAECPDTGWDQTTREECEAKVLESNDEEMKRYPGKDQELREQMAAIDPEHCQLRSGDLTSE